MKTLILALAVLTGLTGCSTLQKLTGGSAVQTALVQAAVDVAVGAAVQNGTTNPTEWAARASRIVVIANDLEAVASGDSVTLAALQVALQARVLSLNLAPADALAANTLITAVGGIITEQTQGATGPLQAAQRVAVTQVLTWVVNAANAYTAHAKAVLRANLRHEQKP